MSFLLYLAELLIGGLSAYFGDESILLLFFVFGVSPLLSSSLDFLGIVEGDSFSMNS